MIRKLYPQDDELLDKYFNLHEQSQINKSVYRSTSHVCNASIKKINEKSLNESRMLKTNMSFRSSNTLGISRIINNTKGFSITGYSGFNNFNKTGTKLKLEPLKENEENKTLYNQENSFESQKKEEKIEIIQKNQNQINENSKEESLNNENFISIKEKEFERECDYNNTSHNTQKKETENSKVDNGNKEVKNEKDIIVNKLFDDEKIIENISELKQLNKQKDIDNDLKDKNDSIKFPLDKKSLNQIYSFNNIFNEKVKKKVIEKDIEKKIKEQKIKLNNEMLKVLKEEKIKENERNIIYNKANSEVDKRRLENLIAMERVISSEKITRLNE